MKELLQQFVAEAAELLEQVDAGLLALERDPGDRALLDVVFRAAHTLKGSSGLFDVPQLTRLTHAAEDLMDAVRSGRVELTAELTDDLLTAFDLVRGWLGPIERTGALPPDATAAGAALSARLRAPLGADPTGLVPQQRAGADGPGSGAGTGAPAPGWVLTGLGPDGVRQLRDWLTLARTSCRILRFEPDEQCFFSGADPLHLVAQTPAIEALSAQPREPWPALADFDEYRCLLTFTVATRATRAELDHVYRYVPDELELVDVDADALTALLDGAPTDLAAQCTPPQCTPPQCSPGAWPAPADHPAVQLIAAQLGGLRADLPPEQAAARIAAAGAAAGAALSSLGGSTARLDELSALIADAVRDSRPEPLADLLESVLGELTAAAPDDAPDLRDGPDDAPPAERRVGPAERRGGTTEPATEVDLRAGRSPSRVLKVDQGTVDRLLDLVGELVVAKNGLPFLATAAEEQWNARPLGRQIKAQYGVVNRISEELQAAVMDVRMLPMSVAFSRFPRMVRDLARTLGKQVVLEQEGEDTAADKDVIEMLADPLVHLVRNSLDHGIETPQERLAASKPAQAVLRLRAAQEPDAVVIDIVDDGRGIDPARVLAKAIERGLVDAEQAAALGPQEVVNLVFLPGFSTAEQISDVSGRGVGMDAVRASVEAAGGSVRLTSELGRGSTVTLRVPLSMAVSRVMVVGVAGQRFGVPFDVVTETVRLPRDEVRKVGQRDVIVLRDTVLPLLDLAEVLKMSPADADQDLVSVLVTRLGGQTVGLVVQSLQEGAEVIVKPMAGVLSGSREFCGTALLGDGSVLLVLDLSEVLARAGDAD